MAHKTYITYKEYAENGGSLNEQAFTLSEHKCRKLIDRYTDSRIQNMVNVPDAVKMCMVSLINIDGAVGAEAQAEKPIISGFNTDGYSESYKTQSASEVSESMERIIRVSLYGECDDCGIPLLYRGCC